MLSGTQCIYYTLWLGRGDSPPAAGTRRPVKVSFGGSGSGPLQMRRPTAVAHHKRILYVADAGNRRIMRLRLTIDW